MQRDTTILGFFAHYEWLKRKFRSFKLTKKDIIDIRPKIDRQFTVAEEPGKPEGFGRLELQKKKMRLVLH